MLDPMRQVTDFVNRDAELLDDSQFDEWLATLHDDLLYTMPIRTTVAKGTGDGFRSDAYFMYEDKTSLITRVRRLQSEYAWSDDPRPRSRRFVTNVRVVNMEQNTIWVKSNILFFRSHGETAESELLSAQREDTLVASNDDLLLLERTILLDHSILPIKNISFFL